MSYKLLNQAKKVAVTDHLTQLYNRRQFETTLCQLFDTYGANRDALFCLLVLDIDYFKRINDTIDHLAGDRALVVLSKFLTQSVAYEYKKHTPSHLTPPEPSVYRLGGDEFAVLLPYYSLERALALGHHLAEHAKIMKWDIDPPAAPKSISVSIGCGQVHPLMDDPQQLYQLADTALFRVKRAGRGTADACRFEDFNAPFLTDTATESIDSEPSKIHRANTSN